MARNQKQQVVRKPAEWQINPDNIQTKTVQYWRHGVMVTAMTTNEQAKQMVSEGRAFVISSQAIGALTEDGQYDS